MITQSSDCLHTVGSRPGNILFLKSCRDPPKLPAIFCYRAEAAWITAAHGVPPGQFHISTSRGHLFLKGKRYKESIVRIAVSIEEILPRARWKKTGPGFWCLTGYGYQPERP